MTSMYDYRTIIVGTDGSALATPTVARAAWLAAQDATDLVVVCAYSDLSRRQEARNVATLGGDARVGHTLGRPAAKEALANAVAIAQQQKATVSAALLVDADPAQALLSTARDRGADLIVVGALRDQSIADRLLGTVATEVIRQAECEVLIVRPRAGDGATPTSP